MSRARHSMPGSRDSTTRAQAQRAELGTPRRDFQQEALVPQGAGHPLQPALRSRMESRFDADFGNVRIRDDAAAAAAANRQLARAFTFGHDIFFNEGRYRPDTPEGQRLIAHELAHVVQQTASPGGARASATHEAHADAAARAALGAAPMPAAPAAALGVQCEPLTQAEIDRLDAAQVRSRIAQNEDEAANTESSSPSFQALADERDQLMARGKLLADAPQLAGAPVVNEDRISTQPAGKDLSAIPAKSETGRPTDPEQARAYAVSGIVSYGGAETPFTDGTGPSGNLKAGPYLVAPAAIICENGEYATLYYVAYHRTRQRCEWIIGPAELAQFRSGVDAYEASAATGSQEKPEDPVNIPMHPDMVKDEAVKGEHAYYMMDSVPATSKKSDSVAQVGPYDIVSHSVNTASGQSVTLYYTARDRETGLNHWVIGSDALDNFKANIDAHHNAAAYVYANGPPHEYEAESAKWTWGAVDALLYDGKWSDAFGHLGKSWSAAKDDPKWQLQVILSSVPVERAIAPALSWGARRLAPATLAIGMGISEAVPAVTMRNTGSTMVQLIGPTTGAEVRQVASQELAPVAVSQAVREASPVLAPAVTKAATPFVQSIAPVLEVATLAAKPAVAAEISNVSNADVDSTLDDAFAEHAPTTSPSPKQALPHATRTQEATDTRADFGPVRPGYAQALRVAVFGQVHHAIEVQVLSRYPGVYTPGEINDFANMRGIPPELGRRTQLHNSKIREILDRHYRGLNAEIARRGLQPGTSEYNQLVRQYLDSARQEVDWALGQFFSEQRAGLPTVY
jgi:Domain of unknown function (DUF4157)